MVDSIVLSSRKMAGFYLNLKVGVVVNNETIYIESNGKDNFTYKYLLKELFTRYPTMHLQTLKIYWIGKSKASVLCITVMVFINNI